MIIAYWRSVKLVPNEENNARFQAMYYSILYISRVRFKEFIVNQGRTTEKYSQRAVQDIIMNIISVLVQQHS